MARAIRGVRDMPQYLPPEQIGAGVDGAQAQAQWVPFCFPPQGMNCTDTPATVPMAQPRWAFNLVPDGGMWKTRYGTAFVGSGTGYVAESTQTIVYARHVIDSNGVEWTVRWSTVGVDVLVGNVWTACTGPTLAMNQYSHVAMTGWAGKIIFSDGQTGMYALDFSSLTYSAISGAPSAQHLTMFNRRVIASVPDSSRVQWCVAGDYTDWTSTNLGAGYEDLLSAPDGGMDSQTAVIPVSDEVAYLVRSNSLWQMEPTRNLEAPFAFSRVVANLGTRWAATCCAVPGGVAFMSDNGVYMLRGGQVEDLTPPIRRVFVNAEQKMLRSATMCYDQVAEGLRLAGDFPIESGVPGASAVNIVLRWHFRIGGGWTADSFADSQDVRAVSSTLNMRRRLSIGELTGTIGSLTGVIGDLGVSQYQSGILYVMSDPARGTNWVAREAPEYGSDTLYDTRGDGLAVGISAVLASGAAVPGGGFEATIGRTIVTVRAGDTGQTLSIRLWMYTDDRGSFDPPALPPSISTTSLFNKDVPVILDEIRSGWRPRVALVMLANVALEISDLRLRYTPGSAATWVTG